MSLAWQDHETRQSRRRQVDAPLFTGSSSQRTERSTSNAEVSGSTPDSPTTFLPSSSKVEHTPYKCEGEGSTPSSATNVQGGGFHQLPGAPMCASNENNRGSATAPKERGIGRPEQAHARNSDPQTSKDAAAKVCNLGPVREKILHILGNCSRTDEQIAERYFFCVDKFNWPKCSPSGLRSRRAELVRLGFVCDSGERGLTSMGNQAVIWKLRS